MQGQSPCGAAIDGLAVAQSTSHAAQTDFLMAVSYSPPRLASTPRPGS
jgi:hypothetical protein